MLATHVADDNSSSVQLDALMRLPTVRSLVGNVAPSTIWRWIQMAGFPQPVRLSDNVVAWRASEIRSWIESRQTVRAKPSQRKGGRGRKRKADYGHDAAARNAV